MSDRKLARVGLLKSILEAIVDEWGFEVVRDRLDEIKGSDAHHSIGMQGQQGGVSGSEKAKRAPDKASASTLAAKVSLPPGQKQLVQQLATQFDNKLFLPTAGDIRYFFEVHGEVAPAAKQRSESFRKVLRLLSSMSESALRKMIEDDAHSGPSRLAPLSEAMRGVGEQRTSYQESTGAPTDDAGGGTGAENALQVERPPEA
jgi:hypothetical protein